MLKLVETRGRRETARRLRGVMGAIFRRDAWRVQIRTISLAHLGGARQNAASRQSRSAFSNYMIQGLFSANDNVRAAPVGAGDAKATLSARAIGRSAGDAGRRGGTRTPNPRFWRPVLYQLSYTPTAAPFAASVAAMQAFRRQRRRLSRHASGAGAAKLGAARRRIPVGLTGPSQTPPIGRRPAPC